MVVIRIGVPRTFGAQLRKKRVARGAQRIYMYSNGAYCAEEDGA